MTRRTFLTAAALIATAVAAPALAQSGAYPEAGQPIRLVVPFPPGGTADVVGRLFAQQLAAELKTTVVVENKAGAGGSIGTRFVADAKPDGYTLLLATSSTHGTNPAVYKKLPYDAVTDFTPITQLITVAGVLSVHPSVKAPTLDALIKDSKARPHHYTYASSGAGGLGHLGMELLKSQSGADILHVAYRGAGPAFTDVIGGQVSMIWEPLPASLPFIQAGQLRAIAVAAPARLAEMPNTPTFKEAGIANYDVVAWNGFLGPKGLPADITNKLHAASVRALNDPKLRARFKELGGQVVANSPADFAKVIRTDVQKWKNVAASSNITLD